MARRTQTATAPVAPVVPLAIVPPTPPTPPAPPPAGDNERKAALDNLAIAREAYFTADANTAAAETTRVTTAKAWYESAATALVTANVNTVGKAGEDAWVNAIFGPERWASFNKDTQKARRADWNTYAKVAGDLVELSDAVYAQSLKEDGKAYASTLLSAARFAGKKENADTSISDVVAAVTAKRPSNGDATVGDIINKFLSDMQELKTRDYQSFVAVHPEVSALHSKFEAGRNAGGYRFRSELRKKEEKTFDLELMPLPA